MITLKLNGYSKKEIQLLATLLEDSEYKIFSRYCGKQFCDNCEVKHICEDMTSAKLYTIKNCQNIDEEK